MLPSHGGLNKPASILGVPTGLDSWFSAIVTIEKPSAPPQEQQYISIDDIFIGCGRELLVSNP